MKKKHVLSSVLMLGAMALPSAAAEQRELGAAVEKASASGAAVRVLGAQLTSPEKATQELVPIWGRVWARTTWLRVKGPI